MLISYEHNVSDNITITIGYTVPNTSSLNVYDGLSRFCIVNCKVIQNDCFRCNPIIKTSMLSTDEVTAYGARWTATAVITHSGTTYSTMGINATWPHE